LEFIQPGKPAQNDYLESFNDRLRDECLNAQDQVAWRRADQGSGEKVIFAMPRRSL
jgi:transposase InsO family protein